MKSNAIMHRIKCSCKMVTDGSFDENHLLPAYKTMVVEERKKFSSRALVLGYQGIFFALHKRC